jgi:hypothetical protein
MTLELDHVFICCDEGAPQADALVAGGLIEGSPNAHPGQGTANRRFFFANSFLELLWVANPAEAQSDAVRATQLWDRWHKRAAGTNVCPFGLVLRPGPDDDPRAPFPAWSYRPSYLPEGLSIEVASGVQSFEPLLFYLPFARGRAALRGEPTDHPAGIRELVSLRLSLGEASAPSPAVAQVVATGLLSLRRAPAYLVELRFLGERAAPLDLRPHLPLVFVPAEA